MKKPTVFMTRHVAPEIETMLETVAQVDVWEQDTPLTKEDLLQKVGEVEALYIQTANKIDAEVLEHAKNLRIIANMGVGYDNIDVTAAKERGIIVTNTPGVLTEATADLTFALLLATGRRLIEANRYLYEGAWKKGRSPFELAGRDCFGATIGIFGMGRIGEAVARRAKGFSMKVLYSNRSRREDVERELGVEYRAKQELLREADYVVVLTPLTPETKGLIGAEELALMKPTACIINVSRGGTVDEEALYQALVNGTIRAAGLDVFQEEPVPLDHPLLALPNVVALPHIGSATYETRMQMAALAAENIIAVFSGKEPVTPV